MGDNKQKNFDREAFLKTIVTEFVNKGSYDSRQAVFTGYMTLINNSTDATNWEINQEKIKIVERCYSLFNNESFNKYIENIKQNYNPTNQQLVSAITKTIFEKSFSGRKRQYDMSQLYAKGQINSNSLIFVPAVSGFSKSISDLSGIETKITHIGTLHYSVGNIQNESIEKYTISRQVSGTDSEKYDVYSYIDLNELETNKDYRDAVLDELLSKDNIKLSNTSGYIGNIVSTSNSNQSLPVGKEQKSSFGFYRYQFSKNYALEYDTQELSAVIEYERKKTLSAQQKEEAKQEHNDDLEK